MRVAPHKTLPQATLFLALLFAAYPVAQPATPGASAHRQPTPIRRHDPHHTSQIDPKPTSGGLSAGKNGAPGASMPQIKWRIKKDRTVAMGLSLFLKKGPLFPLLFNMSNFEVKAAIRGDWPVFVAYELPQPGVVTLTIKADKVDPFVKILDGTPGRHELRFNIPARFGEKVQAGSYTLVAMSDDTSVAKPVELQFRGIAVGEAVGSLGIDHVSFKPDRVVATPKTGRAEYSFHSLFDFKKVSADFRRVYRVRGVLDTKLVAEKMLKQGIRRDKWAHGEWDCREGKNVSKGLHQLHVRAWNSGGWVTSFSEQLVEVH